MRQSVPWPAACNRWLPVRPLAVSLCRRMVFHFLKYPVETDDKVEAVHDEAYADQANQGNLLVT